MKEAIRSRLLKAALAIAMGAAGAATYQAQQPSAAVLLAMELGSHFESSGRHIGTPYVDKLGKGQPLTVCNGVTGAGVVAGVTAGRLHLWPIPSQAGEIKLHVLRFPLRKLANDNDRPEIRQETHPALVEWMLYRAYSRTDADMQDAAKAATALRKFVAEFGEKHGARNEQWMRDGASMTPGPIA